MSELSIRFTAKETPEPGPLATSNGKAGSIVASGSGASLNPPRTPAAPLAEGDAARLLQLIISGQLDLTALARAQRGTVPLDVLEGLARQWLFDCEHSFDLARGTTKGYALTLERCFNWLASQGYSECGENELRAFFVALTAPEANLRANITQDGQRVVGLSSRTRALIYANLRVFFNWCVRRGYLTSSPLARIEPPRQKSKVIHPFTIEQISALLKAAREGLNGARDYAILSVMFDCGLRAQELCDLRLADVDFKTREIKVWHGKGDKERTVVCTPYTQSVLWNGVINVDSQLSP